VIAFRIEYLVGWNLKCRVDVNIAVEVDFGSELHCAAIQKQGDRIPVPEIDVPYLDT
jgi:hypothetical protein